MMEDIYKEAKKRVRRKQNFRKGLITFCIIAPLLLFINFRIARGFPWSLFAVGGWAIGLISEYLKIYDVFGSEDKEIEKEMKRLKQLKRHSLEDDADSEQALQDLQSMQGSKSKPKQAKWNDDDLV